MKKIQIIFLLRMILLVGYGCNNNIYSEQLKKERQLIESYIAQQGINVVDILPADNAWGEKTYYRVPDYDNFYFHMVSLGDTTYVPFGDSVCRENAEIQAKEEVLLRFKRYNLDEPADTLFNWGALDGKDPIKFEYLVSSDDVCSGWQVAVKYMKYHEAECKIICPSKLGFSEENSTVTPYGYDLKMKIKRW